MSTAAARWWPLLLALLGAFVIYLPTLNSAFYGDDYLLLLASRDMSWPDFLRAIWDPGADPGLLQLSETYWRPLSFLSFRVLYPLFGDRPLPYHLVMLGIHIASFVLVYFLALQLMRNRGGAAVSTLVMALHPAGFESIAWISAINSAGLPLALGAWLAFAKSVDSAEQRTRNTWLGLSLTLVALSLAYRETAVVIVAAMLLWYLLAEAGGAWRTRRTLALAGPYLLLLGLFVALSGPFSGDSGSDLVQFDADVPKVWWFYVRQALVPSVPEHGSLVFRTQQVLGVFVIAGPFLTLWRRQWLTATLGFGFLVSIVPYAMFNLGFGPRYFYFPTALFALFGGALFVSLAPVLERKWNAKQATLAVSAGGAAVAVALVALGYQRIGEWRDLTPDVHQQWVDQVTTEYPELPENGGLFVVNTPPSMALLDAYIVRPMVAYLYPGSDHPVYVIDPEHIDYAKSIMKPEDRLFIFEE